MTLITLLWQHTYYNVNIATIQWGTHQSRYLSTKHDFFIMLRLVCTICSVIYILQNAFILFFKLEGWFPPVSNTNLIMSHKNQIRILWNHNAPFYWMKKFKFLARIFLVKLRNQGIILFLLEIYNPCLYIIIRLINIWKFGRQNYLNAADFCGLPFSPAGHLLKLTPKPKRASFFSKAYNILKITLFPITRNNIF